MIEKKIYHIDIDNTIAKTEDGDYANAQPIKSRIKKVNKLAQQGHKIVMCTARGAITGINWMRLTKEQLDSWGVQYHEIARKPYYDLLIDDHAISANDFFQ